MKKKLEDWMDLDSVVCSLADYEKTLFSVFREKNEYVQKCVLIDDNYNVISKEYSNKESKERIEAEFREKGYYIIGYFKIWYSFDDEYVHSVACRADDLKETTDVINALRENDQNRESASLLYTPTQVNFIRSDDKILLEKAREFARIAHDGQVRLDGTEFFNHPRRVAENIRKFYSGPNELILETAGNLHDTAEDTKVTISDLERNFGRDVAGLVLELTNDDVMKHKLGKSVYLSQKMIKMSDDALFIKLCDRLDNISDLENTRQEFRARYSKETLEIIENLLIFRKMKTMHLKVISEILVKLSKIKNLGNEKCETIKGLNLKLGNICMKGDYCH